MLEITLKEVISEISAGRNKGCNVFLVFLADQAQFDSSSIILTIHRIK